MRVWSALLLLSASTEAFAIPVTLNHSGRLLDASGAPVSGLTALTFRLWDQASGGNTLHTEAIQVLADDGYYAVTLGGSGDLDSAEIAPAGVWIEVSVGTTSLGRSPAGFVPLAAVARSVHGGIADVTEVKVGGTTVIAPNRDVNARSVVVNGVTAIDTTGALRAHTHGTTDLVSTASGRILTSNASGGAAWTTVDSLFSRITANVKIPGSAYSLGENPGTRTSTTACPANTTIVAWGALTSEQYWGSMTHWYAYCVQSGNGVQAQLYTEYGYGGHDFTCWGLCVKTQ